MAIKKPKTEQTYTLTADEPADNIVNFRFWIVGDTPLIVHAWSQKAKVEMLTKQKKTAKKGRDARDPDADFQASLYRMGVDAQGEPAFGFPSTGIKNSILSVAHKDKGIARSDVMSALFIDGVLSRGVAAKAGAISDLPLVRVWAPPPVMREDMVKVGVGLNKTASLAYRGQFDPWAILVTGQLNTTTVSLDNLKFLVNEAGMSCGIGEWRNEKRGMFGAYHLAKPAEAKAWEAYARGEGEIPAVELPVEVA